MQRDNLATDDEHCPGTPTRGLSWLGFLIIGLGLGSSTVSAATPHLVKNINATPQYVDPPTDQGSYPDEFVNFDGQLAFTANDGVHGNELWISDGSAAGTRLLADVNPGPLSSNPNHLIVANGALYFFATDAGGTSRLMHLAAPDGTPETLAALRTQHPTASPNTASACQQDSPVAIGSQVYFSADDGISGAELWTTDGTVAGTRLVIDLHPGAAGSAPCNLTVSGNRIFFLGYDGVEGSEVFSTDGTAAGTARVAGSTAGLYPQQGMAVVQGSVFFNEYDPANGSELWKSDGTPTGSALFADVVPGTDSSYAHPFGALNGQLLFGSFIALSSDGSGGYALWTTDATLPSPTRLGDFLLDDYRKLLISGNQAVFSAYDSDQAAFVAWATDGTAAGTHPLKSFSAQGINWFEAFNGVTLFDVTAATDELWRTDGTVAGTTLLATVPTQPAVGPDPWAPRHRLTVGQRFFFVADDQVTGPELYVLDNDAPSALADAATSSDGAAVTIAVLANDTDDDGTLDATTVRITQLPAHGTATVGVDGTITYVPATGYAGTDSFTYTVADKQGATSLPGTVSVSSTQSAASTPAPPATAGKGGGGALTWLELMALCGLAVVSPHSRRVRRIRSF